MVRFKPGLGDYIVESYFDILSRIRNIRDKGSSRDLISSMRAWYVFVSAFLSEETREEIDRRVEEFDREGKNVGYENVRLWQWKVMRRAIRDEELVKIIGKKLKEGLL